MNSKNLSKRLQKLNYTLTREHSGWLIRSNLTSFSWSFTDLKGVQRFTTDEENLSLFEDEDMKKIRMENQTMTTNEYLSLPVYKG